MNPTTTIPKTGDFAILNVWNFPDHWGEGREDLYLHPHVERQCGEETLQLLLIVSTPQSNRAPFSGLDRGPPESKEMTVCRRGRVCGR